MANIQTIKVPDIGDFADVEVVDILVKVGDELSVESPLITIETDKATMDVPSPQAGRVTKVLVANGDRVSEGSDLVEIEIAQSAATGDSGGEAPPPADTPAPAAPADTPDEAAASNQSVTVPDIGEFDAVEVIEVLVAVGDEIDAEAALITLESDKAAMDVPSPVAGKVVSLEVKTGDKVSQGDLIAVVFGAPKAAAQKASASSAAQPAPAAAPAAAAAAPAAAAQTPGRLPPINEAGFTSAHAGPSVRKLARELGVDLGRVNGTGVKGRITANDVKAFVKSILSGQVSSGPALPSVPKVDFAKFGEIEEKPLSRIQKISGPRLQASWINLPHVTQFDNADFTATEETRQREKGPAREKGVKLTPLAFIMRACVLALRDDPKFNTSLNAAGDALVYKKYVNLGFAADTPGGLVVPVVHNADKLDVMALAVRMAELAEAARDGKLKAAEMQGGTFTISSLGGIGGTAFTPIINAPEVAILGVSRSSYQPVYNGKEFEPRLILPLSLSYDHRVIDGAAAARFTGLLGKYLADPEQLMAAPA